MFPSTKTVNSVPMLNDEKSNFYLRVFVLSRALEVVCFGHPFCKYKKNERIIESRYGEK